MEHNHKHQKDVKTRAIHRIKIVQGHLKKIQQMLEDDKYCVDIVHQSRAVQSALKKIDLLIIEDHLNHCVIDQVKNGEEKKTTEELLKLFDYK
ncbi:MAG: metal-sensing transcriptional repressor [Candidatus Dojkabacteria bacterium]|nr:metal-sensing transcriptional repressor [Candidatus Dojkabacteria bacterium]MDQ7021207.1 metal-sensing transcriptional repressor [Candidatus Dojkabacteria bacterium]